MKNTPIPAEIVDKKVAESGISSVGKASIREVKRLINEIEQASGKEFVRMEMGIPGLPPCAVGVEAQIEALKKGVAAIYPDIEGIPALKQETARFVKNFIDLEVEPENCIPTVGSMMGGMAGFMTFVRCRKERDTTLFIDPGFPVQKQQHRVMGLKYETFDVYNFRGPKLRAKLESYLEKGNIHTIMYSNPNNPSWICFTEEELQIIGDMANKYDVFVFEDLAYFGMDFRQNISAPGIPPYQPSVGKYTDNYALLISGSKAFSYAGERIALMIMSTLQQRVRRPGALLQDEEARSRHHLRHGLCYQFRRCALRTVRHGRHPQGLQRRHLQLHRRCEGVRREGRHHEEDIHRQRLRNRL